MGWIAFPLLVYFALQAVSPRALGIAILALYGLRLAIVAPRGLAVYSRFAVPVTAAVIVSAASSLVWNDPRALLLTPALVNLALLLAFAFSFAARETVIEALALAQMGSLSPEEHVYCRALTRVWCGFFLANAAVTTWLALAGPIERWTLYTGLVAYVLMGGLFAGEFIYRHWRFRRYVGLPTDRWLRRWFPPDDAA